MINPPTILIFGIGVYLMMWWNHENRGVPNPHGHGVWRSAPSSLRHLLRRGDGPVLIGAVALQAMAAIMVLAAVSAASRFLSPETTVQMAFGSVAIPIVVWTYLWMRG
jgi:hypothetical protein